MLTTADPDSPDTLGRCLKIGRIAKGLGQAAASTAVGVSQPTLSAWECDRKVPSLRQTERLAHLYGIDLRQLAALNRKAMP